MRTEVSRLAPSIVACLLASAFASPALADTFGSGANGFDIDFVTIGNPGNAPDATGEPNPAGAVSYSYRIGKFEISEQMIDKANALGGLGISKRTQGPDKPARGVTWFEAASFVNWLNTSTGSPPAYKLETGRNNLELFSPGEPGYDATNRYRHRLAKYFLPSADEWYKAAYYDPASGDYHDFPTASDSPPMPVAGGTTPGTAVYNIQPGVADITRAGGLSSYGTMAQGGNVWEFEETDLDLVNDVPTNPRGLRGGSLFNDAAALSASERESFFPVTEADFVGFRVASAIPEPSSILLLAFGSLAVLRFRKCR